jgi:hypothetical protein
VKIIHADNLILVDREALTLISGRSKNTIRARCEVSRVINGKPFYDVWRELQRLSGIPTRQRHSPT